MKLARVLAGFMCISFLLLSTSNARAQEGVWQDCVYPKTKSNPDESLSFLHPIFIYSQPSLSSTPIEQLKLFEAFFVASTTNGFLLIAGANSGTPDFPPGQIIGWVKQVDFESQAWRNCN